MDTAVPGYELLEQIGAGGFGAVFRAFQPIIEREVAIKVILPQFANQPDFIRRFEMEAQLVARLEHPFIVPLYDYWRDPDGAFLIMRYLRGGSLRERLKHAPLSPNSAERIIEQIAAALMSAHRAGVIHRDLKPANILLDEEGNAYLTDFGIAKTLVQPSEATKAGMIIGSPAYLSPEQIRSEEVSPATDIYAFGIMIYEMLAGNHPFPSDLTPTALIFKHLSEPMPLLKLVRPDLPTPVDEVIQRATAKEPTERFPDTLHLAESFRKALRHTDAAPIVGEQTFAVSADEEDKTTPMSITPPLIQNPYKGLRAFQQADAADFFGREALTKRLIERMTETHPMARFLAVVGPSGSGKSSVVKAGLIPALRHNAIPGSECWYIAEMLPGTRPLDELEIALLRVAAKQPPSLMEQLQRDEHGLTRAAKLVLPENGELLLVIDQFEEVFMLTEDPAQARAFLNLIQAAVTDSRSHVRVVITLRADFYDRPLMIPDFSELISQRTQVIVPLTANEIERAIVVPAERVGVKIEPKLVASIVAEVSEQPGALPMLQYALTELFERRSNQTLTSTTYQNFGGVMGVLAKRADEVCKSLETGVQDVVRQLFLRLVTLGEGTEDTRRRVKQSELLSLYKGLMQPVIETFGAARLLTFDRDPETREPTVEVAHEAIIREWKQLRLWLDESRDDVRLQRLLAAAANEWHQVDQDTGYLLYGSRLAQFDEWVGQTRLALTNVERAFLEASITEREQQEIQEQKRQAREHKLERRSRNVLRILAAVLFVAAVGAIGLSVFAFDREEQAQQARQHADQSAAEAQSMFWAVSAQQVAEDGNILAIPLALAANRIENPSILARSTLSQVVYAPGARRLLGANGEGHTDEVQDVAVSPDGQTALSASSDGTLILWNLATGNPLRTFEDHTDIVGSVVFSPDGQTALSTSLDQTLILWDVATSETIRRFEGHTGAVYSAAFSPDSSTAISASEDQTLILWDVATGAAIRTFTGHTDVVESVAFSPDGQTVLSASDDSTLILWNVATGEILRQFEGDGEWILSVAFSPDGKTAISGGDSGVVVLWDLETGETLHAFEGHTEWISSVTFSPDGKTILSCSGDNSSMILWDVETGKILHIFRGHSDGVSSAAFTPNGQQMISSSFDQTLIVWDLYGGDRLRTYETDISLTSIALSPDGKTILSGSETGSLILWDVATAEIIRRFEGHTDWVNSVAISPNGSLALSAASDGQIIVWDMNTGRIMRRFEGHEGPVYSAVFSPDGQTILSGGEDGQVILWDVATGDIRHTFEGHTTVVNSVTFSPDGQFALSGSRDKTISLWDINTGEQVRVFEGHTGGIHGVSFNSDGTQMLSASWDGSVILWDVATGTALHTLREHIGPVELAIFSPTDSVAVSASGDGTLMIWDLDTGERLHTLKGHTAGVYSVVFSADGQTVFSASADSTLMQWRVDSFDELLAWTQANRYVRDFTCEERAQYRIAPLCD